MTNGITDLRNTLSSLVQGDLETVRDALDNGRFGFDDVPYSIMDIWTLDSTLYEWEDRITKPLTPEEVAQLTRDLSKGWQAVGALIAGGLRLD